MTGGFSGNKTESVNTEEASIFSVSIGKETALDGVTSVEKSSSAAYPLPVHNVTLADGREMTVTIDVETQAYPCSDKSMRSASTSVFVSWAAQPDKCRRYHCEVEFDIMVDPGKNYATGNVTVRTKLEERTKVTLDRLLSIPIEFKGDYTQLKKRIVHAHSVVIDEWPAKLRKKKSEKDEKKVLAALEEEINAAISEAASRYTDNQIAALMS